MNHLEQIIKYLIKNPPSTEIDILYAKRKFSKSSHTTKMPTNAQLLKEYRKLKINQPQILNLLRKRQVRTISGIAPIAVLTKPYPCPGNCAYCPNEPNMPKSYLSNEPAVMRAILCKFNPYKQVQMRLRALANNGHPTDKLELIIMGGTWSYLPDTYQRWYIKECFRAANDFPYTKKGNQKRTIKELIKQQTKNETARSRIIGLTLETRPDYITPQELKKMRLYGCTRIEIGIQHIDDKILLLNRRGQNNSQAIKATKLMRDFGFKITYHLMLNLPGSTISKDLKMFKTLFSNPNYQPDQIKIYPCVVSKGALIYHWYKQSKWKPYSTKQLINLLINIKTITPPWVRIIRVIRDIPEESIIAGNKITNLRQYIKTEMSTQKKYCKCIRCREIGHQIKSNKYIFKNNDLKLVTRKYKVSNGQEYFLSFESKNNKVLFAFLRLYLPQNKKKAAIIRELHTYGQVVPIGKIGSIQHSGLGKKLLIAAEKITQQKHYTKLSIISGVGVRGYYKKLGYTLDDTYMIKNI